MIHRPIAFACVLALSGLMPLAQAQDAGVSDARAEVARQKALTDSLINTLVDSGLLSREKAAQLLQQAQDAARAAGATPAPTTNTARPASDAKSPPVIRIPYLTEAAKTDLRNQLKQEVLAQAKEERWGDPGAMPSWLHRLTVEGDVRVRFQHDGFARANTAPDDTVYGYAYQSTSDLAWAPDLINTQNSRDRMTLRARVGVHADLGSGFDAMVRLSTGNASSSRNAVTRIDQANSGMRCSVMPGARMLKIVVMKLIAPRIEDAPATCSDRIAMSMAGPGWNWPLESGG